VLIPFGIAAVLRCGDARVRSRVSALLAGALVVGAIAILWLPLLWVAIGLSLVAIHQSTAASRAFDVRPAP
jgi:hypothetical protein